MRVLEVPTGHILIKDGYECISLADYGKEANMFARFLGLTKRINTVAHKEMLPLEEKWFITISTQYGCSMGCTFCDVPKVGVGTNIKYSELLHQVKIAHDLHPEVIEGKRLNIHFARMGEPTWNNDVLSAAYRLKQLYRHQFQVVHPVISTMMPRRNSYLYPFLKDWMFLKNEYYCGEAGLQLSINSTNEAQRSVMFNNNQLHLEDISKLTRLLVARTGIQGRKITLNFALGNYEIDAQQLRDLFDPEYFLVKLTPMHITDAVVENGVNWVQDPYLVEEELHAAGFDVIIFIPSEEGRITCGNAILSGSLPDVDYKENTDA
jgi:23S rRNA (adenine2503-C2)-methyltransferase